MRSLALPILALAGLLALTLFAWRDGVSHLVSVWRISPTYAHGFLVPLVSAGLVFDGWRKGEQFATWPLALVGVAGASGLFAFSSLLDIQIGHHIAIAAAVVSLVALICGQSFALRHRFALAFLFCAVPVGEELVPLLQEVTAGAIISSLNLLDIPAIRQGMIIRTEPGDFRVAEACAGLRFLVGMVVSGILFAHLLLKTRWKQAVLIAACVVFPVIANLIRAVTVVLIGVWSDLSLATGFDHLVYGWGLFAVVFGILFLGALKAAEEGAPMRPAPAPAPDAAPRPLFWALAAGMILAGGVI